MINRKEEDKDLVAEQPGLGLSFIGLFLAFFMGLAIRAALSPERVQSHLKEATEKIHKDFDVRFDHAFISFADGIWPELAVVIQNVQIVSNQSCYLTPLAEINEIKLPLSFRHLFQGQILIHEVLADEVNLSLRSEFKPCAVEKVTDSPHRAVQKSPASERVSEESSERGTAAPAPVITRFENVSRKNPIDTIQIATLKIHYLPIAFTSTTVSNFKVILKAEEPRWISMTGRWNIEADSYLGDANSFADLAVDMIEGDDPTVNANLQGSWREGQFHVSTQYHGKSQSFAVESSAHHLPLSQIIPILKKYRWVESEFNGRQAWFSGSLKSEGRVPDISRTPVVLSNFKLEGDMGEITCNHAQVLSVNPLQFKPIDFDIRGLKIKEFLTFVNRPHPSPALGDLGIFTGTAHFVSPQALVLRGDYSGLEFIFSNRGTRKIQTLSLISGELELSKDRWHIQLDRVKPADGIFEGKVTMVADRDFRKLGINAKVEELTLSSQVQNLMTGGGRIGPLSGEVQVELSQAEITDLKGHLNWDELLIEGVEFRKPKIHLQTHRSEILLNLSAQEMELNQSSPFVGEILRPVFEATQAPILNLKSPSVHLRTEKLKTLVWEKFQAQSRWGGLKSQGNWNSLGELSGVFSVGSPVKWSWQIKGTRNQPQMVSTSL